MSQTETHAYQHVISTNVLGHSEFYLRTVLKVNKSDFHELSTTSTPSIKNNACIYN